MPISTLRAECRFSHDGSLYSKLPRAPDSCSIHYKTHSIDPEPMINKSSKIGLKRLQSSVAPVSVCVKRAFNHDSSNNPLHARLKSYRWELGRWQDWACRKRWRVGGIKGSVNIRPEWQGNQWVRRVMGFTICNGTKFTTWPGVEKLSVVVGYTVSGPEDISRSGGSKQHAKQRFPTEISQHGLPSSQAGNYVPITNTEADVSSPVQPCLCASDLCCP